MQRIKPTLTVILILVTFLPSMNIIAKAQGNTPSAPEPDSGSVLCPPGVYTTAPDNCLPLGPSEYLANLAQLGITLPIQPLPAYPPNADLNDLPYRYFKVNPDGAALYNSLADAIANVPSGQSLLPGTLYVSYTVREETDQGVFYQLRSGWWISGDGGGRLGISYFQGLQFSSQPRNTFGWLRDTARPRTAAGLDNPETGRTLYRYNIVQVYSKQTANEEDWDMIGPDEWVEARFVAEVAPRSAPPPGITTNRWIDVNLQEQTLAVYENNRLVFATLIASGVDPFWTRPGLFKIYKKLDAGPMSGSTEPDRSDYYYLEDVPWTMYFDEDRALHGAYWHNMFGYPRSHGCVNLSIGDSHWLYNWANVGDYVYVYDPSHRTPEDPSLYGAGAP